MAGEGSMLHAIKSLKFNRSQRNSQKFERPKWQDYPSSEEIPGNDPIKATPELLEEIRTRKQLENKKRKNRDIMLAILSVLLTIVIIYLVTQINYVGIKI